MIKYSLILIFLSISCRYAFLLYKGRIDFSKFTKKTESSPIYTSDLSGVVLSTINSKAYFQYIVLFLCWPLFLIRNPYSFFIQICSTSEKSSDSLNSTEEIQAGESDKDKE